MDTTQPELNGQAQLIPIGEAAELLGVSIDTIRRWDKAGKLKSVRLNGKDRLFNKADLEKFKADQPLSIVEAANELHVSPSTLRRLDKRGELVPDRNEKGERVYPKALIESYKTGKKVDQTANPPKEDTTVAQPPVFKAPVVPPTYSKVSVTNSASVGSKQVPEEPKNKGLYVKKDYVEKKVADLPRPIIPTPPKRQQPPLQPISFVEEPHKPVIAKPIPSASSAPAPVRLASTPTSLFPELTTVNSKKSLTAVVILLIALIGVISVTTVGLINGTNVAKQPKKIAQQTNTQPENQNAWDYLKQMVGDEQASTSPTPSDTVTQSRNDGGNTGNGNTASSDQADSANSESVVANFFSNIPTLNALYSRFNDAPQDFNMDSQPFGFNVGKKAGYLYVNLMADGTYFQIQDNKVPVFTVDADKNIIAAKGSNLDLRGTLTLDGSTGEGGQVLTSGEDHKPHWTDQTQLIAGGLKCDTCVVTGDLRVTGSISSGEGSTIDLNLVAGGIVFGNPDGTVGQDTANFFYDNTNNRLGIGTTTPSTALDVVGAATISSNATVGGNASITGSLAAGGNAFTVNSSGAITGVASITTTGGYTQSGSSANRFSGSTYFTGTNVGIGTTSPSGTLDIRQQTNGSPTIYARRNTDSGPSGDFITYYNAAGDTVLYRVDNSGNVTSSGSISGGAQTITSTSSPQLRVQYDSSNEVTLGVNSTGTTTFGFAGTSPKGVFIPTANSTTAFQFQNAAGTGVLNIDTTNSMVGINTTAPQSVLHLKNDPSVTDSSVRLSIDTSSVSTARGGYIIYRGSGLGSEIAGFMVAGASGNGATGTNANDALLYSYDPSSGGRNLKFATGSSPTVRMTIDTNGNVGIGNSSPGSLLTVGSGSNFTVTSTGYTTINSDLDVTLSAGTNIDVSASAAPTVDLLSLSNSGFGTTTNNIDGLSIAFTQADDADSSDTNAGLNIAMTSSSGDADTLYGVNIGNITAGSASEYGLRVGTGWDRALDLNVASGSGKFNVYAGGTADNYFAGNVGIGTTAPTNKLDLRTTVSSLTGVITSNTGGPLQLVSTTTAAADVGPAIKFGGETGNTTTPYSFGAIKGAKQVITSEDYRGYLSFYTTNSTATLTERMRINGSGFVGINTTGDPTATFDVIGHVYDSTMFVRRIQSANDTGLQMTFKGGTSGTTNKGIIGYTKTGSGSASFFTNEVADYMAVLGYNGIHLGIVTSATPEMTIKSGKVGINTTNPMFPLEVNGNAYINGTLTVQGATTYYGDLLPAVDDAYNIGSTSQRWTSLRIGTGTSSFAGNVGIGTTSPGSGLQVGSTTNVLTISSPGAGSSSEHFGASSSTGLANSSVAIGNTATVGDAAHNSVVIGRLASSSGSGSTVVIGSSASTTGSSAVVIGTSANGNSTGGVVIGTSASISGINGAIAIGNGATATALGQLVFASTTYGLTDAYFGPVTASSPAAFTLHATGGSGSNIAGAALNIAGGIGTGTGVGGDINFKIAVAGSTGSSANSLATVCTISGTNGSLSCPGSFGASSEHFGALSIASGQQSTAFGYNSAASATNTAAFGYNATASQTNATAIGSATTASNSGATAIGELSTASGANGTALGVSSTASASNSTALGAGTTAGFTGSVALGVQATTTAINQLVGGSNLVPISDIYFGKGVTNATPTAYTINGTGGSGTDIAGGALQIAGGKGTGSASGGSIIFQTSDATTSGSTLQSLTTKMTILASGNVGIGTTSPSTKLHVSKGSSGVSPYSGSAVTLETTGESLAISLLNSNSNASAIVFGKTSNNLSGGIWYNDTSEVADGLSFRVGGNATRMVLNSSGNLGIGTTAPSTTLDVNGAATFRSTLSVDTLVGFSNANQSLVFGGTTSTLSAGTANKIIIERNGSAYISFTTSSTEAMRINSSGNVGIGTTAPNTALDVVSTTSAIRFGTSSTNNGGYLVSTTANQAILAGGVQWTGSWTARSTTASTVALDSGNILFHTNTGLTSGNAYTPTERMRIDTSGNVGIGTTAPGGLLDVSKSVSGTPSSTTGAYLSFAASTFTDNNTASSGTATGMVFNSIAQPTLAASNSSVTTTTATTLLIAGAPAAGTNETITNQIALQVNTGTAAGVGLVIKAASSQTGDLQQWQNSSGTILNRIGSDGKAYFGNVAAGGSYNFYGSGTSLAVFQHAGPSSGDVIVNAIHSGTVTGSVIAYRAATNSTTDGYIQLVQSGAGDATFMGQALSTGDVKMRFDLNGGGTNWVLGLDNSDSDKFKIATGNSLGTTDRLTITTSGNVGIGTTTPVAQLELTNYFRVLGSAGGATGVPGSGKGLELTYDTNSSGIGYIISYDRSGNALTDLTISASNILLKTTGAGTESMRVDSSGNVGIGSTAPAARLDVYRNVSSSNPVALITEGVNSPDTPILKLARANNIASPTAAKAGLYISDHSANFALHIEDQSANPLFTVKGDGKVGVGTTAPGVKAHIYSNTSATGSDFEQLRLEQAGIGDVGIDFLITATTGYRMGIDNSDNDKFKIGTSEDLGSNNILTLTTSTLVGIGTTTPAHKVDILDADATASRAGLNLSQTGAMSGTGYGAIISKTGASTTNVGLSVSASGATNNYGLLVPSGRVGIGSIAPSYPVYITGATANGSLVRINPSSISNGEAAVVIDTPTTTGNVYGVLNYGDTTGSLFTGIQQNGNGGAIFDALVLGTGDAVSRYGINGGQTWTVGLDNSDSDKFKIAGSGALGSSDYLTIDTSGSVGIGTTSFGTSAAKVLALGNGTAPGSSPADSIQLYAEDVAASSELKVRDEAGNVTTLSPHNYSLFRPKEDYILPWSFYSRNDNKGKEINVDMYGMVQAVELMSGQQFIYARDLQTGVDLATKLDPAVSIVSIEQRLTTLEGEVAGMKDNESSDQTLTPEQQAALGGEGTTTPPVSPDETQPTPDTQTPPTVDPTTVLADFLQSAVTFEDNLTVNKNLEVKSDATIYGTLIIDSLEVAHGFTIHGDATFLGKTTLAGETEFGGHLSTTNPDVAGQLTIPAGKTSATLTFGTPFGQQPIVNLTLVGSQLNYSLENVTPTSFTIKLKEAQVTDTTFNWFAITQSGTTTAKVDFSTDPAPAEQPAQPVVNQPTSITDPTIPASPTLPTEPVADPTVGTTPPENTVSEASGTTTQVTNQIP